MGARCGGQRSKVRVQGAGAVGGQGGMSAALFRFMSMLCTALYPGRVGPWWRPYTRRLVSNSLLHQVLYVYQRALAAASIVAVSNRRRFPPLPAALDSHSLHSPSTAPVNAHRSSVAAGAAAGACNARAGGGLTAFRRMRSTARSCNEVAQAGGRPAIARQADAGIYFSLARCLSACCCCCCCIMHSDAAPPPSTWLGACGKCRARRSGNCRLLM